MVKVQDWPELCVVVTRSFKFIIKISTINITIAVLTNVNKEDLKVLTNAFGWDIFWLIPTTHTVTK